MVAYGHDEQIDALTRSSSFSQVISVNTWYLPTPNGRCSHVHGLKNVFAKDGTSATMTLSSFVPAKKRDTANKSFSHV